MMNANKNSGVNEMVELPVSETGLIIASSNLATRVKRGPKSFGNWKCPCCQQIFETRRLLIEHKRQSVACHEFCIAEGHKRTNAALRGRKRPGRKLSDEAKRKLSEAAKNRASYWFYSSKNPILYKCKDGTDIKLDSKWELEVVKRLDELNIEWFRPKITFEYKTITGETHSYRPDFFVPQFRCFLEIKSPWIEEKQNKNGKIDYIKNNYPFIVWLESLESCKTFVLQDMKYDGFFPLKEEENQAYIDEIKKKLEEKKLKKQKTKKEYKCEKFLSLKEERWQMIENSNIDFSKFGWVKEASKLFGVNASKAGLYIKKHYPEFYKTCFVRQKIH